MQRVLSHVVSANLEVQVRSGHSSRTADATYDSSSIDNLPFMDQIDLVMRVDGDHVAAVAQDDDIAVAAQLVAINHFAFVDGVNRRAFGDADVDAIMKARSSRSEP